MSLSLSNKLPHTIVQAASKQHPMVSGTQLLDWWVGDLCDFRGICLPQLFDI
jgi:hypothetical protein